MNFRLFIPLLATICLVNTLNCVENNTFDPDRVHLIDYNPRTENMLFRGDIPRRRNGGYNRGALIRGLKAAFARSRHKHTKFPKKIRLVVISMMTLETPIEVDFLKTIYAYYSRSKKKNIEVADIPFQQRYCKRNTDLWYWWWVRANDTYKPPFRDSVTFAELAETLDLSEETIHKKLIEQTWDGYSLNFPGLIDLLQKYMEEDASRPYAIYIHSRNGINRTGSTDAAYHMKVYHTPIQLAWLNSLYREGKTLLKYHKPAEAKTFLMYYHAYLDRL